MSGFLEDEFPPLDCHAHIAADVTQEQIGALGGAQIFAVTRSLDDAEEASARDVGLVWGCGVHPGAREARASFDRRRFEDLLPQFVLVGEIGLDRRGGDLEGQKSILRGILETTADQPVLLSVHSAGAVTEVLELLAAVPQRGALLHWFLGDDDAAARAVAMGAYFSVNAAMSDAQISRLPRARVLPETDFPARRTKARIPGDTSAVEQVLGRVWQDDSTEVRAQLYRNLRDLTMQAGCLDRLPSSLADLLITA